MRQQFVRSSLSHVELLESRQLLSAAPVAQLLAQQGAGLTGEFFQGDNFQNALLTRTDRTIAFHWTQDRPDPIFQKGVFTARWTGQIEAPQTGTYTFSTSSNSGTRLVIDGTTVIDNFTSRARQVAQGSIVLTAGQKVDLTLEFVSPGSGHAPLRLLWAGPGIKGTEVVPASALSPATPPTLPDSHGLLGAYYLGTKFNEQVLQRLDPRINYFWPGKSSPDQVIVRDNPFSALWTGQIQAQFSETYTFYTRSDDGATLTINGQELINDPHQHEATTHKATIALIAGQRYDFRMTYFENTIEPASVKLMWSSASQKKEVVPFESLYSYAGASAPLNVTASGTGPTSATVSWTAASGATQYQILRSTTAIGPFVAAGSVDASSTSFTDTGLTPSTTYYYEVTTTAAGLTSSPSNVASATTSAPLPTYASQTTIYGLTTSSGLVYSIDTNTGAVTQIGTLMFGTAAAGRDPVSGNFFYTSTGNTSIDLAQWDPRTGTNTLISSSINVTGGVLRAAFRSDGAFFLTAGNGDLFQLNASTGAATAKGTITVGGAGLPDNAGDMAFAPDGTLYIVTNGSLYSIAAATVTSSIGASSSIPATLIGSLGVSDLQVAFGQNGILYGAAYSGQLYTVNLATAGLTSIGTPSGVAMGDLASVPLYADLTVAQSASSLTRGSTGTYTLTVGNAGPNSTTAPTTLVDTLPAGVSFVSASGAGWSFSSTGSVVTMTYSATLAPGVTAPPITLTVAVDSSAAASVTNAVAVSTTIFDPNTANNVSALTMAVT